MAMVDMKRNKADMKAEAMPMPDNEYPYGLCLHLDTDELDKLGIKKLPEIGDEVHMDAVGKITRVSSSAAEGSDEQNGIEVQITMLELTNEGQETADESVAEEEGEDAEADSVYGKAKTLLHNAYRGKR